MSLRQDLENVMRNFELISDVPCQVGESATWDAKAQRFLWADIPAGIGTMGSSGNASSEQPAAAPRATLADWSR